MMNSPLRRLLLLRHAKAARPPGTVDHERPLSDRGRHDARVAGRLLVKADWLPDLVLCSTARRTRETWELAAAELAGLPPVRYESRLYAPSVPELLAVVHEVPAHVPTLLVVGHNPSLRDAILMVAGDGVGPELEQVREKLPTAAIALLTWRGTWAQLGSRTALLTGLVVARGARRKRS
ncbi:SixA phosphatase family protein [Streptomyces purpurogeneiscleroticus]|uniref:SixA phosphatase family protein n=1 Tax=Streptomyces purpurogeneiscleroticus TaxID=68259 RepID=UPI001CBDC2D4|nr:histidine phosphatase family protein [Streptomyces purpurogeneiscleroticus]MBZ4017457.1 phosphohistidine phosphatase [Streptomyces purpurogeneiscleroticus]